MKYLVTKIMHFFGATLGNQKGLRKGKTTWGISFYFIVASYAEDS